ncbi:phage holin family protein [Curtobacterium flaccumfaciens]|nr:phage holin family protein [Curtobacterium flaccumfaciens]
MTAGLVQKALEPVLRAVREEVASARREIGERASGAKTGLVLTGVAVGFALTTLVALAGFAVALLALALPLWAATGITFAAFAILTAILFVVGLRGIRRGGTAGAEGHDPGGHAAGDARGGRPGGQRRARLTPRSRRRCRRSRCCQRGLGWATSPGSCRPRRRSSRRPRRCGTARRSSRPHSYRSSQPLKAQ